MRLSDFKALTFDCYGTLIDWETGITEALAPLAATAPMRLSMDDILSAHARLEAAQQALTPAKPYRDILAVVYRRLAEEWGVPAPWEDCLAYGRSVKSWPAFPDSADALAYLKQHYKLVIVSNVDNESFAASNAKLGVTFDAIYSAEDIGSFKPADKNFQFMIEGLGSLGVAKGEILHTAESLFHDHRPANRAGLANCWIDRRAGAGGGCGEVAEADMPSFDFTFTSLGAFVDAHRAEIGG